MHILETYALLSGCKISKCSIHTSPIELPNKKLNYITFHPHSTKGDNKQYSYWHVVLDLLHKNTKFNTEYTIIQIGEANDTTYDVNSYYLGKTSVHSLAYLIQHSSLHLGYDSFPVHLASHFDIKLVALYSYFVKTCGPYFSTPENIRLFQPDYSKIKPTFGYHDPNRLIDTICSSSVYNAVIELLEI